MCAADLSRDREEGLESRLSFETLISDLSSRFVLLAPDEIDREISGALRRICGQLRIDLAILWQWSLEEPEVIVPTHFHPVEAGAIDSDPMSEEQYPWYREQMLAGRTVAFSSVDELPAEAAVDRASGETIGIRSSLCVPLIAGGGPPIGALAFNTIQTERDWPTRVVTRLQLLAEVITNALSRTVAERALRRSEERLTAGADLARLGHYEVHLVHGSVYADDRFYSICGVPPDRRHGMQALAYWMERLHPDDRSSVMAIREQLHEGSLDPVSVRYRFRHPTEGEKWIDHRAGSLTRDASGQATATFGVVRDITAFVHSEEAARDLSRRLLRAHEEERALLARELHDDVTQRLAVLAIDASRAELTAADGSNRELLRGICAGLAGLSEDVHTLAYQLHPSVLDEFGLKEALRIECGRVGSRSSVRISPDLSPEPLTLGNDAALCLFRVAQEALSNISRHAGAGSASVVLQPIDDGWCLTVRDDGVGFDPEIGRAGRSLGLASMRERVELVNGTLAIESAPGHGTSVVARVPEAKEA